MSAELSCVDPKQVPGIWPHVSGDILRAMERGEGDFTTTERHVLEGKALLWLACEERRIFGVGITQIVADQNGTICNVVAVAGEKWHRWAHALLAIESYARAASCDAIEICGREGWKRLLKDL